MMFAPQASGFRKNPVKIIGEKSFSADMVRGRLFFLGVCFALAYLCMAARAVDLTVVKRPLDRTSHELILQKNSETAAAVPRGDIYDRNGVLLATTLKTASLYADPYLISDIPAASRGLAKIFPEFSSDEIMGKFSAAGKKRFVWIKKNLTPLERNAVNALGEPGLAFLHENRRIYPQGKLLSHLVGFTDMDNKGLSGIERGYESALQKGDSVNLSVDVRLQHVVRREVAKAMEEFSAKAGTGIVMDVKTGEVLAGVSLPDFDPHNAGDADSEQVFNRMTLGTYELGSVIKIFSVAAFLETHDVPMSTSFDARTPLKQGRFTISDYHAENRIMTIPEVFMYSSNIGSAMMGQATGTNALKSFYEKVGLTETMESEFPEIAKPQVPSPWRELNTLTASYGHGFATTPMQFVSSVSSVVNGGTKIVPHFTVADEYETGERVVSEDTSKKMRDLLRLVVTEGTGKKADVPGYDVGGKTGTAEKSSAGGYDTSRLISSFVGVFPVDAPRYAVFILVDEPHGTKASYNYATGGWVSAPVVSKVVMAMASILGMAPEGPEMARAHDHPLKQFVSTGGHD
ncbi:MAG: peptidoglycan D,D-transpeptidase FtsI family protein [Alphaproteobacteria bacterium]